jgi:hypothetical protein
MLRTDSDHCGAGSRTCSASRTPPTLVTAHDRSPLTETIYVEDAFQLPISNLSRGRRSGFSFWNLMDSDFMACFHDVDRPHRQTFFRNQMVVEICGRILRAPLLQQVVHRTTVA